MPNTLGYYNPLFYAQEALIQLEKVLGMGNRVHRGYDEERKSFKRGQFINIRKPSTFTAQDAPSTAQAVSTEMTQLELAYWKEVKFELTDKELAFTGEQIIDEHIRPAAYALADDIDTRLAGLYKDIPWVYNLTGTTTTPKTTDITSPRRIMFENKAPIREINRMHYMVDGVTEETYLNNSAFTQDQGAGAAGVSAQVSGVLGPKYGVNMFANQNVQAHTKGTINDLALLVDGAAAKGATTISLDAADAGVTGTLVAGDTFVIAGNSQRYTVTALNTAAANAFTSVAIYPALVEIAADNAVVTVDATTSLGEGLMFHRNAFALAMAPLSMMGNELGAKIATITDPVTGLAIRSRLYYEPDDSAVNVALDVLYGFKTLDANLACRGRRV